MAETTIGALAVRIGADASELISELKKGEKALKAKELSFKNVSKAAAAFSGAVFTAGAAVFAFTKHVANNADELGKLSQKIGISVESLSAFKYAAELSDVSLESLGQGIKILSRNMAEAQAGTGEARAAFRALGLDVEASGGQLKLTEAFLLELADKFAEMEDGANKTAIAMKVFGKSGADLIPFLNQGSAGIEELRKEAARLGIIISTEAAKEAEKFNDDLKRLGSTAEGLAIKIGGPLITAIQKAAEEMLNAQKRGEGFFSTLIEGFRTLMTGTDEHKWNKEFTSATKALQDAQNDLDHSRRHAYGRWISGGKNVEKALAKVAAAQAEVNRLLAIKPVIAPDAPDKDPKKGGKKKAPALNDGVAKDAERVAKQILEGEEEFQKASAEAWELYQQYIRNITKDTTHQIITDRDELASIIEGDGAQLIRDQAGNVIAAVRQVERESFEGTKRAQDERNKLMMDAWDAEEAAEIERGRVRVEADGQSHSMKLEALRNALLSEEQLLTEQHERKLEQVNSFTDEELEALGGKQAIIERMTEEHEERLSNIKGRHTKLGIAAAKTFFGHMSQLMQTNSKKMFEIGKAAAIAETVINTHAAAMGAYKSLVSIPFVGPALAVAAAGAAIAAGAAQIQAIRAQQVGGGGNVSGSFSANPQTGQPVGTPGGNVGESARQRGPDTIINLPGTDVVSTESVRRLLERLNETVKDGGRIVIGT